MTTSQPQPSSHPHLSGFFHHDVVVLEAQLDKLTTREGGVRARHCDNLCLLGQQEIGSLPLAAQHLKGSVAAQYTTQQAPT